MRIRTKPKSLEHLNLIRVTYFTLLLQLCSFTPQNVGAKSTRGGDTNNLPNAKAYAGPNKKPPLALYNEDPGMWANFKMVMKKYNLPKLDQICVTGTFILYAKPDYSVPTFDLMRLISGIDSCFSPAKFMSMQLMSPIKGSIHDPSVTFFVEPRFQGTGTSFRNNLREVTGRMPGRVESIIIHGDKSFTAISGTSGERYCLKPGSKAGKASKDTICLKMYNQLQSGPNLKDNLYSEVFMGCNNTSVDVYIDDCRKFGSGTLEQLKNPAKLERKSVKKGNIAAVNQTMKNDSKSANFTNSTNPNYKWMIPTKFPPQISKCNDNKELLELLQMRSASDFESPFQVFYPKDKKQSWRTELLDNAFDTVFLTCPDVVVHQEFLAMMREFYIFLAEKFVWSKGKGVPQKMDVELEKMVVATETCNAILSESGSALEFADYPLNAMNSMQRHHGFIEYYYDDRLEPFPALSTVMETIWLVFNSAASVCHRVFESASNFIDDYITLFYEMYLDLEPLKKEWLHPGRYSSFIPIIFGGLNITSILESLAICSTTVFHAMPMLDVIPRPYELPQPVL